jgi:hypothetical protein
MKTSTITRLTGVSRATLSNWKKTKPDLYEVIERGCDVKKAKQSNQAEYGYDGHWYSETGERLPVKQ